MQPYSDIVNSELSMREKVKSLREDHDLSLRAITKALGASQSGVHYHFKALGFEAKPKLKGQAKKNYPGHKAAQESRRKLEGVRQETASNEPRLILDKLSTVQKGHAAEALFVYRALLAGIETFSPSRTTRACDLVTRSSSGYFASIEIKGSFKPNVELRRSLGTDRSKAQYNEEDKVDFFAIVDLKHENVFIIPFAEATPGGGYSTLPGTRLWKYLNRFDLLDSFIR